MEGKIDKGRRGEREERFIGKRGKKVEERKGGGWAYRGRESALGNGRGEILKRRKRRL